MAGKSRKPKTLREKIETEFPEFADEAVTLAIPQMEKRISDMQKEFQDSEQHRTENPDLNQAKNEVKELSSSYNEVKKAVSLKTKYLVTLIREKGGQ